MKPLSIFKNGSHIFISGPVKCKMFCQRNANQKKKKKNLLYILVILRKKKYNYCLNFIIRYIANFLSNGIFPKI